MVKKNYLEKIIEEVVLDGKASAKDHKKEFFQEKFPRDTGRNSSDFKERHLG